MREGALPCPGVGRGSQPSLRAGPALAAAAAALLREACVTQLEQRGVVSSEKNKINIKNPAVGVSAGAGGAGLFVAVHRGRASAGFPSRHVV